MQADRFDAASDAAPGKILHETRAGEMARLNEIPFGLYYGSVDSTPLFVLLAGQYAQTSGDLETLKELWPAMQRALDWIDGPGDPDQDGFVEYFRHSEKGLGQPRLEGFARRHLPCRWADWRAGRSRSPRCKAMSMRPRRLRAMRRATWVLPIARVSFASRPMRLADRFEQSFWCEELGSYAMALDGEKNPCRVRSSNAGQVLFSGIARPIGPNASRPG